VSEVYLAHLKEIFQALEEVPVESRTMRENNQTGVNGETKDDKKSSALPN
jgi:hypothetical protein